MFMNLLNLLILIYNKETQIVFQEVLDLVLESECEMALKKSIDCYTNSLKESLANKLEALWEEELFEVFYIARLDAIESFEIPEQIWEKY